MKILNPFDYSLSTSEWKKMVRKAILEENGKELKSDICEKYKKLKYSELSKEEFGRKAYLKDLDLHQARTKFKFRTSMTQHDKMNQKNNEEYAAKLWKCDECGLQDTNLHLLSCSGYESLREGKDLSSDKHLCEYLQKIFIQINNNLIE